MVRTGRNPHWEEGQQCDGKGKTQFQVNCSSCTGSGKKGVLYYSNGTSQPLSCYHCSGAGKITQQKTCNSCTGTGKILVEEKEEKTEDKSWSGGEAGHVRVTLPQWGNKWFPR